MGNGMNKVKSNEFQGDLNLLAVNFDSFFAGFTWFICGQLQRLKGYKPIRDAQNNAYSGNSR